LKAHDNRDSDPYHHETKEPVVFVLMPFRAEYGDLYELVACPGDYFSADTALGIGISPTDRPRWHSSLVALDEALEAFSKLAPRQAKVVELRYFGGLSEEETAEVLKISTRTVRRDWDFAKSWLMRERAGRAQWHYFETGFVRNYASYRSLPSKQVAWTAPLGTGVSHKTAVRISRGFTVIDLDRTKDPSQPPYHVGKKPSASTYNRTAAVGMSQELPILFPEIQRVGSPSRSSLTAMCSTTVPLDDLTLLFNQEALELALHLGHGGLLLLQLRLNALELLGFHGLHLVVC
jgi:RNA polymerase sigma factor (sigma-70 family)